MGISSPNAEVRRDAVAKSPSTALLADTVSACIAAIGDRLAAKGPLYEPDAEWTALRACAVALEDAARLLTATTPLCVKPDLQEEAR